MSKTSNTVASLRVRPESPAPPLSVSVITKSSGSTGTFSTNAPSGLSSLRSRSCSPSAASANRLAISRVKLVPGSFLTWSTMVPN